MTVTVMALPLPPPGQVGAIAILHSRQQARSGKIIADTVIGRAHREKRQVVQLLQREVASHLAAFGLQQGGLRGYGHRFGGLAHLERYVLAAWSGPPPNGIWCGCTS